MAIALNGSIVQSPSGGTLTFLDSTTGIIGLVSRVLTIYDAADVQIAQYNMGTNLSQNYPISADAFFTFVETIVDSTGSYNLTIAILSTRFFKIKWVELVKAGCGCECDEENCTVLDRADQQFDAANFYASINGGGVNAQELIQAANALIDDIS